MEGARKGGGGAPLGRRSCLQLQDLLVGRSWRVSGRGIAVHNRMIDLCPLTRAREDANPDLSRDRAR